MRLVPFAALLGLTLLPRPTTPSLAELRFMSGCWRGPTPGGGVIEEYYTAPATNLMLGLTRYLRDGRVTDHEFSRIDSALVLTPNPRGQRPVPFSLKELGNGTVVWANPRHDFPQVISYRAVGADSLVARIEGPGPKGPKVIEWRMVKVGCGT